MLPAYLVFGSAIEGEKRYRLTFEYMAYTPDSGMKPGKPAEPASSGALRSAAERAYEHILDSILRGEYTSGTFIEEEPVSAVIGVSRTPIREALRRLAAEGFIELIPRRGARVRGVTPRELRQFLEARFAIESHCIRTICTRKPPIPAGLAHLIGEIGRLVMEQKFFESAELDRQFHRSIVALAGNELLVELFDTLRFRYLLSMLSTPPDPHLLREIVDEHVGLLAALSAYDSTRALKLLAAHLDPEHAPRFHVAAGLEA